MSEGIQFPNDQNYYFDGEFVETDEEGYAIFKVPLSDRHKIACFVHAERSPMALWDINQIFRTYIRYDESLSQAEFEILEKAWDKVRDVIDKHTLWPIVEEEYR